MPSELILPDSAREQKPGVMVNFGVRVDGNQVVFTIKFGPMTVEAPIPASQGDQILHGIASAFQQARAVDMVASGINGR